MSKLSRESVAEFAAIYIVMHQASRDSAVQEVIDNDAIFQDEAHKVLAEHGLDWDSGVEIEALTDTLEYAQPTMPDDPKKRIQIMAVRKELLGNGTIDKFYVDDVVYERLK